MSNPDQGLPQKVLGSAKFGASELLDTKFLEGAPHVCHNRQTTRLLLHNQKHGGAQKELGEAQSG
jgi:hypothetical protein